MDILFFINSIMLGVGLAMDAFSVSIADSLGEPDMPLGRMCGIAGIFAGFQALMPMTGWVCVHTALLYFSAAQRFIPWIALALLAYIGGKMIYDGLKKRGQEAEMPAVGLGTLLVQGVATSIDALSVGFTIAEYGWAMALICAIIIAAVTFLICMLGLLLGRKFGPALAGKATVIGGVILAAIGVEIAVSSLL